MNRTTIDRDKAIATLRIGEAVVSLGLQSLLASARDVEDAQANDPASPDEPENAAPPPHRRTINVPSVKAEYTFDSADLSVDTKGLRGDD